MLRTFIFCGVFAAVSLSLSSTAWSKPFKEVAQDVRDIEVQAKLKLRPRALLVYAKGLCCPSCAIGIRKMISRLAFVDTSKKDSGVELDAKHQLVTIALKPGAKPDLNKLTTALDDAGYEAVHAYALKDAKVVTSSLPPETFRVVP